MIWILDPVAIENKNFCSKYKNLKGKEMLRTLNIIEMLMEKWRHSAHHHHHHHRTEISLTKNMKWKPWMNGRRKKQGQENVKCKCCLTLHMTDNKLYCERNKTEQNLSGFYFALSLPWNRWMKPRLDGDEQSKVNNYYQTKLNPIEISHSEQNNAEQFEPLEWLECVNGMQFTWWIDIQCSLLNDAQYFLDFNQMSNKILKSKCERKVNGIQFFFLFHLINFKHNYPTKSNINFISIKCRIQACLSTNNASTSV